MDGSNSLFVGVDVGGTKVAGLVVDSAFQVRSQSTSSTTLGSPERTIADIGEAIRLAVEWAGGSMSDVAAVGLGVPGRVDPESGIVRRAVNLGWSELPVGETLSAQLGVPFLLENDVRLAALGVQRHLGREATQNMAYVSVGTGIAAGLILDGRIHRGAHGLAGEIGHMIVDPEGPLCLCGAYGCLEVLAAGPAIARRGQEAAASVVDTLLREYETLTSKEVYEAAGREDVVAQGIVRRVSRYLALGLQQLIVAYDVERIVLGGGVARSGDAFLQPVLDELAGLWQGSTLAGEMIRLEMIGLLPSDFDAGTWGAVVLASSSLAPPQPSVQDGKEGAGQMPGTFVI